MLHRFGKACACCWGPWDRSNRWRSMMELGRRYLECSHHAAWGANRTRVPWSSKMFQGQMQSQTLVSSNQNPKCLCFHCWLNSNFYQFIGVYATGWFQNPSNQSVPGIDVRIFATWRVGCLQIRRPRDRVLLVSGSQLARLKVLPQLPDRATSMMFHDVPWCFGVPYLVEPPRYHIDCNPQDYFYEAHFTIFRRKDGFSTCWG